MSDLVPLALELAIFFTVSTVTSLLTWVVVKRLRDGRLWVGAIRTTLVAGIASAVVTELWSQLSHVPRYNVRTLAICVFSAMVAVLLQTQRGKDRLD